jgi:iron complex transport system substrate-binding protein
MQRLKQTLSYARGDGTSAGKWPRSITYEHRVYDFRKDVFSSEKRIFQLKRKPLRIIPHAVGVAEILWAICPREHLIAFNEFSADPDFCFIADQVKQKGPIFKSRQTELVIGYRPDLIFIVFYSGADFKKKLNQARIPHFDLGYFGTIESIKQQVLLVGRIIGQEGNASALVRKMNDNIRRLNNKIPDLDTPVRVLYYDEGGYIPGKTSNFNSICEMIRVINVGAEKGIKSWSQVDNETLLSWNPDIIIVPEESGLKQQLIENDVLSHAGAVKNKKIFEIPGVYLRVDSQFMILSANLLAGIIYETAF